MSSELFESREDDLRQICENVRRKLTDQLPRCVGGGCGCNNKAVANRAMLQKTAQETERTFVRTLSLTVLRLHATDTARYE